MGVPGLWDLLRPAAARTSLSTLAKEAFYANRNGLRALTIGIDASLWIFHAQVPPAGENPFLRTIFFKICTLLQHPVLPVFVFDGPKKPILKRGQKVAGQFGTADRRSLDFKALLNECGLEWWNAPGEAEAELAWMSRQGKIDAVLSDDVDAVLFGAKTVLRNNSPTLSGTQASQHANTSRGDLRTYEVYRSSAICDAWTSRPGTALQTEQDCRMAMIFVALLAGGDYVPEGLETFGPTIAVALAHAGFSSVLHKYASDPAGFTSRLAALHADICEELRTNSTGQIGRRYPDRASKLSSRDPAALFPSTALEAYLTPVVSPPGEEWPGFGIGTRSTRRGMARNAGRGDMEGMARACEKYFEWGTKELVKKKFVSESVGVFGASIVDEARLYVLFHEREVATMSGPRASPRRSSPGRLTSPRTQDGRVTSFFPVVGSSTSPSIHLTVKQPRNFDHPIRQNGYAVPPSYAIRIERTRTDPTNASLQEYRLYYDIGDFHDRIHKSMAGTRIDPKDLTAEERLALGLVDVEVSGAVEPGSATDATCQARWWIADWLVKEAWPSLVSKWEDEEAAKAAKKAKGAAGKSKASGGGAKKGKKQDAAADNERLTSFFTPSQMPAPSAKSKPSSRFTQATAQSKASMPKLIPEDSEEEIEVIEIRHSARKDIGVPDHTHAGGRGTSSSASSPLSSLPSSKPGARSSSRSTSKDPDTLIPPSRITKEVHSSAAVKRAIKSPPTKVVSSATQPTNSRSRTAADSRKASGRKGVASEPIDLCSSDEEPSIVTMGAMYLLPDNTAAARSSASQPSSRAILGTTSRANLIGSASPSPPRSSIPRSAMQVDNQSKRSGKDERRNSSRQASPAATAPTPSTASRPALTQSRLALPVTQRPSAGSKSRSPARSSPSPVNPISDSKKAKSKSPLADKRVGGDVGGASKKSVRKGGRRSYLVVHDPTEEEVWEEIDSTRGGRNELGYGYAGEV